MKNDLHESLNALIVKNIQIDGCEGLLADFANDVKSAATRGLKYIGTVSSQEMVKALKSANTNIIKTLTSKKTFIGHLKSRLLKDELKTDIKFPDSILSKYTFSGKPGELVDGIKTTHKSFSEVLEYVLELEALYSKQLSIVERAAKVSNTEEAVKLIDELSELKHPKPKDAEGESWELPGGRSIEFNSDTNRVDFNNGNPVSASSETESFTTGEFKELLTELDKLSDVFKSITKANESYTSYLNKFNTVIGKSTEHLASLRGQISTSVLSDLNKRIEGNTLLFTFFTGFMPKAVIYLDDYVDALSSFVSKQFN